MASGRKPFGELLGSLAENSSQLLAGISGYVKPVRGRHVMCLALALQDPELRQEATDALAGLSKRQRRTAAADLSRIEGRSNGPVAQLAAASRELLS